MTFKTIKAKQINSLADVKPGILYKLSLPSGFTQYYMVDTNGIVEVRYGGIPMRRVTKAGRFKKDYYFELLEDFFGGCWSMTAAATIEE